MKTQNGFTLIELLVGMAIAAVLLTIAAPSFTGTIERNQLSTKINEMVSTLQYARSESVKRGQRISVCKSDDNTNCGANGYEEGWIVFIDNNPANGDLDAGEEVLKVYEQLDSGFTLRGNNRFVDFISYIPTGGIANADPTAAQDHFVLCKKNDTSKSRAIFIITSGRVRQAKDSNYDGIPEDDSGTNLTTCTPT